MTRRTPTYGVVVGFGNEQPTRGQDRYTVFCSWPGDRRGEYSEEIDVNARNPAQAKRTAQRELDAPDKYEPGGRAVRVVRRIPGVMYL